MKIYLLFFVVTRCNGFENDDDYKLNLVGLQENDKERIYRPCHLRDLSCIRKYFADNSYCTIAKGPAPDPLILERNTHYLPFVNLTIVLNNMEISGLNNAKVREFYVNKETCNLVLAFSIAGLSERSTRSSFRYQRSMKEPIVLSDHTTVTYPSLTYTAVIPKIPSLKLHKADIHAFIDDSNPPFIVGEDAFNSTDPSVQAKFNAMTNGLPKALLEALLFKTALFVNVFIQSNICDFGLMVKSV